MMNTVLVHKAVCSAFQQGYQLHPVREVMVGAVCLCGDKRILSPYSGYFCGSRNKMFSWELMLPFIFCGFGCWGWFVISVVLNVLCSISSLSVIIYSILVMIGYVREIRHTYQFAVPTLVARNRKVWEAALNMILSLQVV